MGYVKQIWSCLGKSINVSNCTRILQNHRKEAGLKLNDQLVAYATRFFAVRLKNYVWSHHRALKAKVQCDFSSVYSPEHTNILRLKNIKSKHRYNTTRHPKNKAAYFSRLSLVCVLFVTFKPNFPVDSSELNSFPRSYGGHSAKRSQRKVRRLGMRLTRVLVLRVQIGFPFVKKALSSLV